MTGQNLLQSTSQKASKTIPNTSPPGQEVIEEHIKSAGDGFEKLIADLENALTSLQDTLDKWGEFENHYETLSDWMDSVGEAVRIEPDLVDDAVQKARQHEEYQVHDLYM